MFIIAGKSALGERETAAKLYLKLKRNTFVIDFRDFFLLFHSALSLTTQKRLNESNELLVRNVLAAL